MVRESESTKPEPEGGRDSAGPGRLEPVLSVLVTGHRTERLHALLDTSGVQALKAKLSDTLTALDRLASEAFLLGRPWYADRPVNRRLITVGAAGAEALAASVARDQQWRLHRVLANLSSVDIPANRTVWLGSTEPADDEQRPSRTDIRRRDRLALNYVDFLVAFWEGSDAGPEVSNTAWLIKEALLSRKPVIWLRPAPDRRGVTVSVVDPKQLTDARLTELDVLTVSAPQLSTFFTSDAADVGSHGRCLDQWRRIVYLPFLPADQKQTLQWRRYSTVSTQPGLVVYAWQWLRYGSGFATERPVSPGQWLRGAALWSVAVVKGRRLPPGLQLQELMASRVPSPHWSDHLVSRLHRAMSALVKWRPTQVLTALRRPAPSAGNTNPFRRTTRSHKPLILDAVFQWFDTHARYYAARHRDDAWLIYYAAAAAVFCAVAGALHWWPAGNPGWHLSWAVGEVLLLWLILGRVLQSRLKGWHWRWMSHRYLAEQVRNLQFGYTTLVLPESAAAPTWGFTGPESEPDLRHPEIWLLQRILVAEGLPRGQNGRYALPESVDAIRREIDHALADNIRYYRHVQHTRHEDHERLHRLSLILFALTFMAVMGHFFLHIPGMLFFTAFLPAWGAAIHGLLWQQDVVRVSASAGRAVQQLESLQSALARHGVEANRGWEETSVRWDYLADLSSLSHAILSVLQEENTSWIQLLQHHEPDLPS